MAFAGEELPGVKKPQRLVQVETVFPVAKQPAQSTGAAPHVARQQHVNLGRSLSPAGRSLNKI